nr:efflux RND transporter periplasmic adaptor subunit [Candidatus Gracilibacteria bacterium]
MKKIIAISLILLILLSSCGTSTQLEDAVPPKYVKTEKLEKKVFSEDLKLTGKIASAKETSISPQVSGIIKTLNYNIGDRVNAGDVLATIDTQSNLTNINLNNALNSYNNTLSIYNLTKESVEKDLETAKLQYENAVTNRDNTYKTTEKQLELAKEQLASVQTQKSNTSKTVDSTLTLSKATLDNAKLTLENFKKTSTDSINSLETKKENLYNTIRSTVTSSLSSVNSALTFVDTTLGITDENKNLNDSYEIFLSAKNTESKVNAEASFGKANAVYQSIMSTWDEGLSDDEVETYFSKIQDLVSKTTTLYNYMTDVLNNSVTSTTFPDSSLSGLKTTTATNKGTILGLKSSLVALQGQLSDLENTIISTKNNIDTQQATLEQALIIAESSYNNTVANTNTSLDSVSSSESTTKTQLENTIANIEASRALADNNLKIAENSYNSANAKYDTQLLSTKTQLDSITGQKDLVEQQLSNSIIKAPFDGIITVKNVEVGTLVSPGMQAFGIANNVIKIVKIDVNAENIKYLSLGKEVMLDKNGEIFSGSISALALAADPNTKLYKVEVRFSNEMKASDLVLGDFIDVYVTKENTTDKFLIIPFSSLIAHSNGDYSVYVMGSGSLVESRKIQIGSSNSHEVVVTDGLIEGDRVIIGGSLSVEIGDKVEEMK